MNLHTQSPHFLGASDKSWGLMRLFFKQETLMLFVLIVMETCVNEHMFSMGTEN
jgi:hypothetical protein